MPPGITLVPDRYGNGTNVIAVPAGAGFRFSYGPGSFARHRAEAERLGLPLRILDRPDLAWDIDEPGDVVPVAVSGFPHRVTARPGHGSGDPGRAGCRWAISSPRSRSRSDMPVPAIALAVGAHPDDIEFGCGATLAKWAAAGCRFHHLVLTDGSKGSWDPGRRPRPRWWPSAHEECRAAADVIDGRRGDAVPDATTGCCSSAGWTASWRTASTSVGRSPGSSGHCGRTSCWATTPGADTGSTPTTGPPGSSPSTQWWPHGIRISSPNSGWPPTDRGRLFLFEADEPNHVEDAGGFEDTKVEALLCHRSQWESTMGIDAAGARTTPPPRSGDPATVDLCRQGAAAAGRARFPGRLRFGRGVPTDHRRAVSHPVTRQQGPEGPC